MAILFLVFGTLILPPTLFGAFCRSNFCNCQRPILPKGPGKPRVARRCPESLRATSFTRSFSHMPCELSIWSNLSRLGRWKWYWRAWRAGLKRLSPRSWKRKVSNMAIPLQQLFKASIFLTVPALNTWARSKYHVVRSPHDQAWCCCQSHCNTVFGQPKLAVGSTILAGPTAFVSVYPADTQRGVCICMSVMNRPAGVCYDWNILRMRRSIEVCHPSHSVLQVLRGQAWVGNHPKNDLEIAQTMNQLFTIALTVGIASFIAVVVNELLYCNTLYIL